MRFKLACAALVLCSSPALAAKDVMASTYGNTVISTGGMAETHTHYRPDHTFDMTGTAMGFTRTFKGTWYIDRKGHLCRTYVGEAPSGAPNPLCTVNAPHKIGDKWTLDLKDAARTVREADGMSTIRQVTLVKGIQ